MNEFDFNDVRDRLKEAGVINSEEDMSVLFGKGPSYVSSRKSKNEPPSLDALTHLAFNIESELDYLEDEIRHGTDLDGHLLDAARIVFELQNELFANLRRKVRGGDHDES